MRRGDAGCCASAAPARPNGPISSRVASAKVEGARAIGSPHPCNGIGWGWYAQALRRSFSIARYDVSAQEQRARRMPFRAFEAAFAIA